MANADSQIFFSSKKSFHKIDNKDRVNGYYLVFWYKPHYYKLLQSCIPQYYAYLAL